MDWTKVGVDVVTGGAAGALDQIIQNADEKRGMDERAAGTIKATEKLPIMKQYGTYYNYGVPLLALVGSAMGFIRGNMATRLMTAGAELAGRKITHQVTTKADSKAPSAAYTEWRQRAAAKAAMNARYEVQNPTDILV
jgi:hypothetical protein